MPVLKGDLQGGGHLASPTGPDMVPLRQDVCRCSANACCQEVSKSSGHAQEVKCQEES